MFGSLMLLMLILAILVDATESITHEATFTLVTTNIAPLRLGPPWQDSSYLSCIVACRETYPTCQSVMFNPGTGKCTPGSALVVTSPLPSPDEGALYVIVDTSSPTVMSSTMTYIWTTGATANSTTESTTASSATLSVTATTRAPSTTDATTAQSSTASSTTPSTTATTTALSTTSGTTAQSTTSNNTASSTNTILSTTKASMNSTSIITEESSGATSATNGTTVTTTTASSAPSITTQSVSENSTSTSTNAYINSTSPTVESTISSTTEDSAEPTSTSESTTNSRSTASSTEISTTDNSTLISCTAAGLEYHVYNNVIYCIGLFNVHVSYTDYVAKCADRSSKTMRVTTADKLQMLHTISGGADFWIGCRGNLNYPYLWEDDGLELTNSEVTLLFPPLEKYKTFTAGSCCMYSASNGSAYVMDCTDLAYYACEL